MAPVSPEKITVQRIADCDALNTLCQSFDGLPNNPASLYLSNNPQSLIIYVAPTRTVNIVSLPYLIGALHREERSAAALRSILESAGLTKVFFDARKTAKILFDSCGIRLAIPICTERSHIHEVQMMELALRRSDSDREWLAGLDRCIDQHSNLDINVLIPDAPHGNKGFDERILHLPVLWKKYHDHMLPSNILNGGSFWVANIREATRKRLAVSCGETHRGYSVDGAKSAWDRESIEELTESWNEDVSMDSRTAGDWLGGAEHWDRFRML